MELITNEKPHKIVASEGKKIRKKDDIYIPAHVDEFGEIIEEYTPYYCEVLYVPDNFTEKMMCELYIEEN